MRTLFYLLQKEFIHVFRDKTILPIIFVMPFVQLFILIYAANFEIKNIKLIVVDCDHSTYSAQLIEKFGAGKFFKIVDYKQNSVDAYLQLEKNKADVVLVIPENFEKNLAANKTVEIQLLLDALNQTKAGIANIYSQQIISKFDISIVQKLATIDDLKQIADIKTINVENQFWYNPELNYKVYMFPGILVLLVTIIGMMLSAFNLIREKEKGTIEQINVTPIHKFQFIIGKTLPFYIIALFELSFGLFLGWAIYKIHYIGNLLTLFVVASFYLFVILGFGLLISTMAQNQIQVMFISWFTFMVFILMSGLFTPVESMPHWAQKLNYLNPLAYFIKLNRLILLKGSTLKDVYADALRLLAYGIVVFSLATMRFRKTTT